MTADPSPSSIRAALAFDVQRLRRAADRVGAVERALRRLERDLALRATTLTGAATCQTAVEMDAAGQVHLRYAQAQATAQLARRAKLGELVGQVGRLTMIASMAVNRWVSALDELAAGPAPEFVLKGHIDAGRLAHRMLCTLKRRDKLRSGCGQLASAVMVADLVHPDNLAFVEEQIAEGLFRSRNGRGVKNAEEAIGAASRALRAAAGLLESIADRAEPAARALEAEAERVEATVAAALTERAD